MGKAELKWHHRAWGVPTFSKRDLPPKSRRVERTQLLRLKLSTRHHVA